MEGGGRVTDAGGDDDRARLDRREREPDGSILAAAGLARCRIVERRGRLGQVDGANVDSETGIAPARSSFVGGAASVTGAATSSRSSPTRSPGMARPAWLRADR